MTSADEKQGVRPRASLLSNPGWLTAITALLAAAVPLAAGTQAYVQRSSELAIAREQNRQTVRLAYLDKSLDPKSARRVLSYLANTSDEDAVRNWARTELDDVEKAIQLEADLRKALLERDAAQNAAADAMAQADALNRKLADKSVQARVDLEKLRTELKSANDRATAESDRHKAAEEAVTSLSRALVGNRTSNTVLDTVRRDAPPDSATSKCYPGTLRASGREQPMFWLSSKSAEQRCAAAARELVRTPKPGTERDIVIWVSMSNAECQCEIDRSSVLLSDVPQR